MLHSVRNEILKSFSICVNCWKTLCIFIFIQCLCSDLRKLNANKIYSTNTSGLHRDGLLFSKGPHMTNNTNFVFSKSKYTYPNMNFSKTKQFFQFSFIPLWDNSRTSFQSSWGGISTLKSSKNTNRRHCWRADFLSSLKSIEKASHINCQCSGRLKSWIAIWLWPSVKRESDRSPCCQQLFYLLRWVPHWFTFRH